MRQKEIKKRDKAIKQLEAIESQLLVKLNEQVKVHTEILDDVNSGRFKARKANKLKIDTFMNDGVIFESNPKLMTIEEAGERHSGKRGKRQ